MKCIVMSGEFTQYDPAGRARVFREGDEIELTDAEAAAFGAAVEPLDAPPAPAVADEDDEPVEL